MLGQSGLLTLLGMAVVFSFIIILICSMKLLNVFVRGFKLDRKNEKSSQKSIESSAPLAASAQPAGEDIQIIAAIAAAVHDRQLKV